MSDQYRLKIDVARLAGRLSASVGRKIAARGATNWLRKNGFEKWENDWVTEAANLSLLDQSEVTVLWPADEPAGEAQIEYPAMHPVVPTLSLDYVLTNEKRHILSLMQECDQCTIPSFLCAAPAAVVTKMEILRESSHP